MEQRRRDRRYSEKKTWADECVRQCLCIAHGNLELLASSSTLFLTCSYLHLISFLLPSAKELAPSMARGSTSSPHCSLSLQDCALMLDLFVA